MLYQTERLEHTETTEKENGFFDVKELKMLVISAFDKEMQNKTHQKNKLAGGFGLVATPQSREFDTALLRSSVSRGSDNTLCCHSLPLPFESSSVAIPPNRKARRFCDGLFCLAGAGGFEPATHGFGVALKVLKTLKMLTFAPVSTPFSHKTVCHTCV